MQKNKKQIEKYIFPILIIFSILASIKLILVDYTMDEEYQIVMAYRNLSGDAIFGEMWEPHQTSAFLCIWIMYLWHLITGTYTGVIIALRVVTECIRAGLSYWIYRVFGKRMEHREAMLLGLLYFNSVPKLIDIPEFSNMQLWFFTIMALALMEYYYGKADAHTNGMSEAGMAKTAEACSGSIIWLVVSSCALALEILSYPSCIILFPVTIGFIAFKSGKKRIRDILVYILSDAACAGVWLAIVLPKIGLETLIRNARYTVEFDLTHTLSGSTDGKFSGSITFLWQSALMLAGICVVSWIICRIITIRSVKSHKSGINVSNISNGNADDESDSTNDENSDAGKSVEKNEHAVRNDIAENGEAVCGKYLYAVIAILVSCVLQLVYWLIIRKGNEYPQIHLLTLFTASIILLFTEIKKSDVKESIRPYMYGFTGSVISILAVFYISDLQFFNALPHGMFGVLTALAVMAILIHKSCGVKGAKLVYILFLGFVATAMIGKGGSVKGGRELKSPFDVRGIMKEGPAIGILSDYMCCYIYNSDYEDFRANVHDGENVLIVTNMVFAPGTTPYMFGENSICHFSIVDPTSYDERLLTYWELYPEKKPDVIVVDCWYGQLMEDPNNWIMQYIENDFGYTSYTDGKYVRFYRR